MKNSLFRLTKNILQSVLIVSCLLLLASCAANEVEKINLGEAKIRIINASPELASISVIINDSLKTPQPLKFSQGTSYLNNSAGNQTISTQINRNIVTNSKINLLLKKGKNYSVFVAGKISRDSIIYITVEDNLISPPDTLAKVRFINTSLNSTNLEATFSTNIADTLSSFSAPYRSSTIYTQFKPGNYIIKIREARGKPFLSVGSGFNISKGKIYTIWVKGLINGTNEYKLNAALLTDN